MPAAYRLNGSGKLYQDIGVIAVLAAAVEGVRHPSFCSSFVVWWGREGDDDKKVHSE